LYRGWEAQELGLGFSPKLEAKIRNKKNKS